jgi:hypothetical protein
VSLLLKDAVERLLGTMEGRARIYKTLLQVPRYEPRLEMDVERATFWLSEVQRLLGRGSACELRRWGKLLRFERQLQVIVDGPIMAAWRLRG